MPRNEQLDTTGLVLRDVKHVLNHKLFLVADHIVLRATQDICSSDVFEKREVSYDTAQGTLFSSKELGRKRALPLCGLIAGKTRDKKSMRPKRIDHEISSSLVDDLSVCVACCFSRHGYKDMHSIEQLVRVREYVVGMLEEAGYTIAKEVLHRSFERNNWPTNKKWGCLARISGLSENQVFQITRAAFGYERLAV